MTDATAPTLADFLLARIAEDEARFGPDPWLDPVGDSEEWSAEAGNRVLAVCAAHRRIVEAHELSPYYGLDQYGRWLPREGEPKFWYCDCESGDGMISRDGPCTTLRALASVYAGHDDFREEWAL